MSARCNGFFALSLCLASVSLGAEPEASQSPPMNLRSAEEKIDKLSTLDHLRVATEQLESAGMTEEAASLREVADFINRGITGQRAELARQIRELQNRSEQLRRLTGKPDKIHCRCCFLELSSKAAAEFESTAEPVSSLTNTRKGVAPAISVYKNAEEAILRLKKSGKVTILASPQIITAPGSPATSTSGGEFPISVPVADGQASIEWRRFGIRCEVVPRLLDTGRIQLEFSPEISHRDFKNSVTVNGQTIPGLATCRANAQAEMNLGESLVIMTRLGNAELDTANAEHHVTLFMVTPVATD